MPLDHWLSSQVNDIFSFPIDRRTSSFAFVVEHLKFALNQEVREWIVLYGQACNAKYRKEMNEAFILIEDIEKRLTREVKELEDIRLVMIAVRDLRENEIRIDMSIGPIEESYTMLQAHGINIAREEIERADTLRYRWGKLQNRCVRTCSRSPFRCAIFECLFLVGNDFAFIGYSTD